jgi:hypothetical protein
MEELSEFLCIVGLNALNLEELNISNMNLTE